MKTRLTSARALYETFIFTEKLIIIKGDVIRYDLNQPLGRGVYVGSIDSYGLELKNKFAVKLCGIDKSLSGAEYEKDKFDDKYLKEIIIASKLTDNVNVARYIRHCVHNSELVLVTQLCNKEKWKDLLPTFTIEKKKILLIQLCHGLRYIHHNRIAHRDLKPTNVLLSLDKKNIKIIDFGISKEFALDENKTIIRSTGFNGSYGWVASEMCPDDRSTGFEAWVKADIYSSGLFIYFIFTDGKHPYAGKNYKQQTSIEEKKKPNFSDIENDKEFYDRYLLIDLLMAMLSHEPEARPEITEILQHCITWNEEKKMSFIKVCHRSFDLSFDHDKKLTKFESRKHLKMNGTVEKKMAYLDIKDKDESCDDHSSNDSQNSIQFVSSSEEAPEDNIKPWEGQSVDEPMRTKEEEEALERIYNIIGGDWVKFIKETLEDPNSGNSSPYRNSLTDLVRYIRNTHEYYDANINDKPEEVKLKLGSKNKGMWSFFASNFPEFFPHLFNLMKDELKGDDKEKYLQEEAKNCELPQK
uniref:probable serine/threonine-protein kinase irlE n=1 Tax=Styela clava TaxID=7725 RepID=UPI00193AB091|nr:probable serine/threonine-protein kinase irlE [Styela clava]